ncbi:MAG: Manganese ABC transporter substrate-binding lipoprotein [Phycisphaerae bacterium]|nr:Manganese ABC transporter substrate-binding lipoprotein [Phycisphaerae bacterium]
MTGAARWAAALALTLAGAGKQDVAPAAQTAGDAARPLRVVCTITPLYVFAQNIVGDAPQIRIDLLRDQPAGCPHDYAMSIGDRKRLAEADVVLAIGCGLEPFLDKLRSAAGVRIIELGPACERICTAHQHSAEAAHDHDHAQHADDPHVWLSPAQAERMVRAMTDELARLRPAQAAAIRSRGGAYADRLAALSREMKAAAEEFNRRTIVTHHDMWAYLARDLNLEIVAVMQTHEGGDLSPRELSELMARVRAARPALVVAEAGQDSALVRAVSRETGVPVRALDPLTGLANGLPPRDAYETGMRANLRVLCEALGP